MQRTCEARQGGRRPRGFTLVELLIAVGIVAILAVIAIPSYQFAVIKSNRRAAQGFLMDVALRQNQILLDRRRYGASLAELGVTSVPGDVAKVYTVTVAASGGPPPSYTITATPVSGSTQAGDGTLTLNSAGVKSPADKW